MNKKVSYLVKLIIGIVFVLSASPAASAEDFYKGKTIRFIVGFSAGGGFDAYARLIARHIGRYVPGNPRTLVQSMPGAGSLISANYIYHKAKPDGLTVGNWSGGLVMAQAMGRKGVKFDARKFNWLGVPVTDSRVCALTRASGINSVEKWFTAKRPVKIGGSAPGAGLSDVPRTLKAALGLPIQVVEGYGGTSKIRLAAESGEVAGGCWAWESVKVTWRRALESGKVKVILQALAKRHPDLQDVPNAVEMAKTEEARQLIKLGIQDPAAIIRSYSLPPGTPRNRVAILRKAFMATMKDPKFLAEAKKSRLAMNPKSGKEVQGIVNGFFKVDAKLSSKLKKILSPN